MTKRIRNRTANNNKKLRRQHRKEVLSSKKNRKSTQKSVDEWLQSAANHMATLDIEAAYHAYNNAHMELVQQQQAPSSSITTTQQEQMLHVLEKMGEIQVSLNDPDQARQHFLHALQLLEAQQKPSSWCMLESHANLCLYIGQLSIEQQALEAYLKGVSSLEKCIQLVESNTDSVLPPTDSTMLMDGQATSEGQPSKKETLQQLKQKLSGAYCNVADLYLTDLCDEDTAESDCENYLEKALQLKDNDGEPMVDALQTMANLRLSQHEDRRLDAVDFILRAYEKQRVGSEALASLVGLKDGGKRLRPSDDAAMQDHEDEEEAEQADELLEVEEANNLPEFEFRCQTAKILLECADLLSKKRRSNENPSAVTIQETQCIDAAISVLGSLLAQNDEVVEIWYLTGCAFAAKDPPLADTALFYLQRAQTMLTDIRKGLSQELQFAEEIEREELEQELELNEEQMNDVMAKLTEMRSSAIGKEDASMLED
ncbi:hypothetical protein IV203_019839 [Nitzschia inconspicua]|uniref:Assembly chaperone of rpl4 n=1 Tax=Nitzschia inconspicua TaxID=303405 RepID=A0A9K3K5X7_9STRA|nr:hypothetical protein IV203_020406 [Nitzschia inconspicua]KAG7371269.1 hypothetical protein IV203_019839 [Nitzschia inconspicua]